MRPQTVLVVEDNPISRKLFRLTLGNAGFAVLETGEGAEALVLAASGLPDLILQDLLLPDMDGFDLVARLRADPTQAGTPIIAVSGFLSRLQYGRATAVGFTDFLAKPVEPLRLLEVVRAHLPAPPALPEQVGNGQRVLVVDDDPVQLKLLRIRLEACRFEVRTARNGVEALQIVRREDVVAVISDVLMPVLDGFELCSEMQADARLAQIPVILVSANYVEDADRRLARRVGARDYVLRTPDLALAIEALHAALITAEHRAPPSCARAPHEHHARVVRQLERQAAMNAAFAQRSSMHASMLSVVAGIAETLTLRHNIEDFLPDILASLLEASGAARGALFLTNLARGDSVTGDLVRHASTGVSGSVLVGLRDLCERSAVFERVGGKSPLVLSDSIEKDPRIIELLRQADASSMLLVPFMAAQDRLGILVLVSSTNDLAENDWIAFARTMAVQIGQSLALSRTVSKLAASEKRHKLLMRGARDGIAVLDAECVIVDANTELETLCSRPLQTLIGRPIWSLFAANSAGARADFEHLIDSGTLRPAIRTLLRPDGTARQIDISASLSRIDEQNVVFAILRDVSQKCEAEAALLESVRLATLTAKIGMALAKGDDLEDILGVCAQAVVADLEAVGTSVWLVDSKGGFTLTAHAGTQSNNQRLKGFETSLIGRAALRHEVYVTNDAAHDPNLTDACWSAHAGMLAFASYPLLVAGELIGVVAASSLAPFSDAVLHGLSTIADALAVGIRRKLVERANLALAAQLRQAQKMEAIGRLAGGIAHDFNNMLSVILSYGELLLQDLEPTGTVRADVEEICNAGRRASALTRQLLMFSRRQMLELKILDVNEVLGSMENMLRRMLGADIELVVHFGRELGKVRADRGSLEQVIMNLVVNARDAMPTGGTLTLETSNDVLDEADESTHLRAKAGPQVLITVTDSGTGMESATLGRLFEPFFTTKDMDKGTGLGLSTLFGIIHQLGGAISVFSELGVGSSFKIYVPQSNGAFEPQLSGFPALGTLFGSETILLVEDDVQVRQVTRSILTRHGYQVLQAQNGAEAMMLLQRTTGRIELLLTDVVMPLMSGSELAVHIRAQRPDIKVLCMSGYTDDTIVRHGVLEARLAFLQKPITPESLTRKVREVLDMPLSN